MLGATEVYLGNAYASQCSRGPYSFENGNIDNQCDMFHFWSLHAGGAHFLYADASVHFISYSAAWELAALATIAGGEAVPTPD